MIVDDIPNPLEDFKRQKLQEFKAKYKPVTFNSKPRYVGKIISNGFNSGNEVFMGPFGGLFYRSRLSGRQVPVQPTQPIEYTAEFASL
jgi:hypothetical protein